MEAPPLTTTTPAARQQRLQQHVTRPVERDLDVSIPVDGERLPRLVVERAHHGGGAGDQDESLRLVLVQCAPTAPSRRPHPRPQSDFGAISPPAEMGKSAAQSILSEPGLAVAPQALKPLEELGADPVKLGG
jgi:hypothetical protein